MSERLSEEIPQRVAVPVKKHAAIGLDLLRALAAFTVLLVHVRSSAFVEYGQLPAHQKGALTELFFFVTRLGQEAVLTFFVLSGFLVAGQAINRVRAGSFDIVRYGIDRVTRILLPLIPACIATECINYFVFGQHFQWTALFGNMVGLNGLLVPNLDNNPPLWTLAYEIWFYVVGGLLGVLFCRRSTLIAILGLGICVIVFSKLDARFLLYWGLGGLTAQLVASRASVTILGVLGVVVCAVGVVAFELAFASQSFVNVSYLPEAVSQGLICCGICSTLPALCSNAANRFLERFGSVAASLSGFSYTLYLFHYPTNVLLSLFLPRAPSLSGYSLGLFAFRLIICLTTAAVMYRLFERHTTRMRISLVSNLRVRTKGGSSFPLASGESASSSERVPVV